MSLQDKLYNYEQTPPAKVWDKIVAALDESHISDEFPSTLYNTEVAPPANTWEKIAGSLSEEQPAAIPMRRKSFTLLRYAAAAAVIVAVTLGIIKLTGSNNTGSNVAISNNPDTSSKQGGANHDENNTASSEQNEDNIDNPGNDNLLALAEVPKTSAIKKNRKRYTKATDDFTTAPIYADNEHAPALLADRYVMLMTSNGIVRMSKKLGDLVCCVSGQEQDPGCKDQLKKWQEKIASSPVAPAPGNFMDIFSLLNSLNEDDNKL